MNWKFVLGAIKLLGEPIKQMGFDMSQGDKNFADTTNAQFEVAVKGSKDRG